MYQLEKNEQRQYDVALAFYFLSMNTKDEEREKYLMHLLNSICGLMMDYPDNALYKEWFSDLQSVIKREVV